jgi:hypothetical protein
MKPALTLELTTNGILDEWLSAYTTIYNVMGGSTPRHIGDMGLMSIVCDTAYIKAMKLFYKEDLPTASPSHSPRMNRIRIHHPDIYGIEPIHTR